MSNKELLTTSEWRTVAETCLGTPQLDVLQVSVEPLSGDFGGFLGDHRQVKVTVLIHTSKPPVGKELALFLKRIPDDSPKHTEFVTACGAFGKETGLFSQLFRLYPRTSVPWGPQCYFTRPDVLIMEDLNQQKFRHVPRHTLLDFKHCEALLRTLAVFHAASIMFEESESKRCKEEFRINEKFPDLTYEMLFAYEGTGKFADLYSSSIFTLHKVVDLIPEYQNNEDVRRKIADKLTKVSYKLFDLAIPSERFRNVLCHGDLWANNIFYSYNDKGWPTEVRIVDFQVVRYCPPASDVMMFLHLNTGRDFRTANEKKLLKIYHSSLGDELAHHGYKVEELLTWSTFKESCDVYRTLGRIVAPNYHNLNMLPKNIMDQRMGDNHDYQWFLDETRIEVVKLAWKEDDHYRERLKEDYIEFVECLILNE